jgi:hypothetical protein
VGVMGRVGQGGEMNQALYAHMNNKTIFKRTIKYIYILKEQKMPPYSSVFSGICIPQTI